MLRLYIRLFKLIEDKKMKTIRLPFLFIFFLFFANSFAFGSFSTHTGTCITRTFDAVSTIISDSIIINVGFTNSETHAINGFYYTEHIPQGLTVNTVTVRINGQEISNYLFESGIADEVYLGCIVYRWIFETPPNFVDDNPIHTNASAEIVYSLSSNQEGTFNCDNFNWVGYYQDAPEGQRAAFGYSEDDDKQTISFVNLFEMKILEGWSMISLPITPYNMHLSELFPDAVVVYSYKKGFGYVRVEDEEILEVGRGYWILLNHEKNYNITGEPINEYGLFVNEDKWDMIGGCTFPAKSSVDSCIIGSIYDYAPEVGYKLISESENIEPGKGYWILFNDVLDQCKLTVKTLGYFNE